MNESQLLAFLQGDVADGFGDATTLLSGWQQPGAPAPTCEQRLQLVNICKQLRDWMQRAYDDAKQQYTNAGCGPLPGEGPPNP